VAGIAVIAYLVAGLCVGLGSVLCCLITWAVALGAFALAVVIIRRLNKNKAE
jgi:hypothetical protein